MNVQTLFKQDEKFFAFIQFSFTLFDNKIGGRQDNSVIIKFSKRIKH